ncbi:MAG: AMP-binding protein [Alphaproteobacteria bacterium]|nr:AMP-binding protein [Alphaproteobacteria bacterium]MCB9931387.1 AMP-binding protein [Alphaproteobacteria bacterium]
MPTRTLAGLLAAAAESAPAVPALIEAGRTTSYAALDDLSRRFATGLSALGLGQGDRIALWLPNTPAHYALTFAVWRMGATVVGVNTRFRAKEVEDIVGRTGARALVFWPGFKDIDFEAILAAIDPAALRGLEMVIAHDVDGAPNVPASVLGRPVHRLSALADAAPMAEDHGGPDVPAQIFTTSGTTSAPKFVLHAHASLEEHAQRVSAHWRMQAPDAVFFQTAPLCGTVGLVNLTLSAAARTPQVIQALFDPAEAGELIKRHKVTHLVITDEVLVRMLEGEAEQRPYPSLRLVIAFGVNPPLPSHREAFERAGIYANNAFGMSECLAYMALRPRDVPLAEAMFGGGFPVNPASGIRVRDQETGDLCPPGVPGEIEVSGPTLMLEYADNPEANARAWTEDGWLRTGDLGQMREDGCLVYLSRINDMLRLSGFLVSPAEIEAELEKEPGIAKAQVISINTARGVRAFGFVELKPDADFDEQALIARCRRNLANYKCPVRVVAVEEWPLAISPNTIKIQRVKLREWAEAHQASAHETAAE